jgi:hypothetical protein
MGVEGKGIRRMGDSEGDAEDEEEEEEGGN